MENEPKKKVVKVTDKRRSAHQSPPGGGVLPGTHTGSRQEPPAGGGDPSGRHTEHAAPLVGGDDSSADQVLEPASLREAPPSSATPGPPSQAEGPDVSGPQTAEQDFLADLQRVQADFENYRKRVMRDQGAIAGRAVASLVEQLLPVLDNFERAIAHGEGGEGVALVLKEFTAALEREGVSEVPGEGAVFDPNVHEAVEARDVDGLEVPTVIEVHRRGYMLKDQLLRPAMVVVGRPPEREEEQPKD